MDGLFTVRGVVAGRPRHLVTVDGLAITSFRLLSGGGRARRGGGADRRWFVVSAMRRLAVNAAGSLSPGDPVLVAGRLGVRGSGGRDPGAAVEFEAESIGHDLSRGCTVFTWVRRSRRIPSEGSITWTP